MEFKLHAFTIGHCSLQKCCILSLVSFSSNEMGNVTYRIEFDIFSTLYILNG